MNKHWRSYARLGVAASVVVGFLVIGMVTLSDCEDETVDSVNELDSLVTAASQNTLARSEHTEESGAAMPDGRSPLAVPLILSPLQKYFWTWDEQGRAAHARSMLARECMRSLGFDYPIPLLGDELENRRRGAIVANLRLFGITDGDDARQHGYGEPESVASGETDSRIGDDGEYFAALSGVRDGRGLLVDGGSAQLSNGKRIPVGGCLGEADRVLGAPDEGFSYQLGRQLWIESFANLVHSVEYRTIVADWSACMEVKGHAVTDPLQDDGDIMRYTTQDRVGGGLLPHEAELAVDDVDCKEATGLVHRLLAAESRLDSMMVEANREELERDRRRLDQILLKANNVLAASGQE